MAKIKFYEQSSQVRLVLNQRFLIVHASLIFVCVNIDSRPLNQRFLMTPVFVGTGSRLLSQRFLMTLIFVCASFSHQPKIFNSARISYFFGCVRCLDTSTNFLQQNIHDLSLYDFCMRKLRQNPPIDISIMNKNISVRIFIYFNIIWIYIFCIDSIIKK